MGLTDDTCKQLVKYLGYASLQKTNDKEEIFHNILRIILTKGPDKTKNHALNIDWTLFIYENYVKGNTIVLNARDAVEELYRGPRKYFQLYVNSKNYNPEDYRTELREYFADDLNKIGSALAFVKPYPSPETEEEVKSIFETVKKEKTIIIPVIGPSYKKIDYEDDPQQKGITLRKIAVILGIIVVLVALTGGLFYFKPIKFPSSFNGFKLPFFDSTPEITSENNVLDTCYKDPNNLECNLPNCCLVYSSDKLAQLYIPTDAIDTSTEFKIAQNSDTNYDSTLTYQNRNFRLQDNMTYNIKINNLNPDSSRSPKLRIIVSDFWPDKNVGISKYDTKGNKWSKLESEPKQGAGATIDLENNVDDIFGLFIEYKELSNRL